MITLPFAPEHWTSLVEQPGLYPFQPTAQHLEALAKIPYSITVQADDGRILMVGGVVPFWQNRGEAWCRLAAVCRHEFVGIFRAMKKLLFETCQIRRLEATVEINFEPGHRLMELLGFQAEGYANAYYPDGRDVLRYSFVRGDV